MSFTTDNSTPLYTYYSTTGILNNYLSSNYISASNVFINSNVLTNVLFPYISSNSITDILLPYATNTNLNLKEAILTFSAPLTRTTNTIGINLSSYSTTTNMNTAISTALSSYPNYTYQNAYSSNYISSNIIVNLLTPYDTIALRNIALTSYPNYTYQNAYSSNYISSNIIVNLLTPYDTIALRNIALTSYPTYTYQNAYSSNYISSNIIANVLTPYDTIALRNIALGSYLTTASASSTYATITNLNSKEAILTFNAPLTRTTNTIGIDLSSYSTTTTMNISINSALSSYPSYTYQNAYSSNYISSNIIANVFTPYDTINLRNTALSSYPTYTYQNAYTSNYISSNSLQSQNYINSNSITNVLIPYTSSNAFHSLILNNEPNVKKKFGFTATCSASILMPDNNTYYKYDIDLRNYTGLKYSPNPNTPYRIFNITIFLASVYFEVFSSGIPNILEYKVFISNETQNGGGGYGVAGINLCAIGRPQNYYLNSILPTYFSLLRTADFNYLSIIARVNGTVVNVIIEDLLF